MPRTNIVIDDALMAEARDAAGSRAMRETVELGLKALIRERRREQAVEAPRILRSRLSLGDLDWREARDSGRR